MSLWPWIEIQDIHAQKLVYFYIKQLYVLKTVPTIGKFHKTDCINAQITFSDTIPNILDQNWAHTYTWLFS